MCECTANCADCACARRNQTDPEALCYVRSAEHARLAVKTSGFPKVAECSPTCKCSKELCVLSFLQWPLPWQEKPSLALLRVSKEEYPSWAVIALVDIAKDEYVLEATGEVVDLATHLLDNDQFQPLLAKSPPLYLRMKARGSLARFLT